TVSNQLTYLFTSRQSDFLIIPNGFEGDIKAEKKNKHNLMIYTGTVALSQIADGFYEHLSDFGLKLNFYGDVHNQLTRLVLDKQLSDHIKFHHRVNHSQLSSIHDDADYFLLLIPNTTNNGGILTGKVFEYMAANRPIFAIGPTSGDCAEILYESGIGKMYDYATDFRMALRDFLSIDFKINHKYVERFQRSKQAQQLSAYLERIASLD
ncbi:MAG: hypothetical protein KDD94_03295, partial [Calditrichaeota bacterium]|nr:hypothetical protein [Calditrichota bacterium]